MTNVQQKLVPKLPESAEEMDHVREALEKVLGSPPFQGSKRYSPMFRYVVEQTLGGHQDILKERTIGVEVFGRMPAYDTNNDPVVRFSAGEIRKRLAQFYQDGGAQEKIRFELPLGTYIPLLLWETQDAHLDAKIVSREATQDPIPALQVAETSPSAQEQNTVPFPPQLPLAPVTSVQAQRVGFLRGIVVAVLAAILILTAIFGFRWSRPADDPVSDLWKPLLDNNNPILVSIGRPTRGDSSKTPPEDVTIAERILQPEFRVSITTVSSVSGISGFLRSRHKSFHLHDANTNSLADLHGQPLVLVGANDNKWTLQLLEGAQFQFKSEGSLSFIQDSTRPDFRDWNIDFSQPYLKQRVDYAVLARIKSPTTGGPVLILAGIGANGNEAAGEFALSDEQIGKLLKAAPRDWSRENFEAVLKVEVIAGNTGGATVLATRFW